MKHMQLVQVAAYVRLQHKNTSSEQSSPYKLHAATAVKTVIDIAMEDVSKLCAHLYALYLHLVARCRMHLLLAPLELARSLLLHLNSCYVVLATR
jgi:hypothetical protein